MKTLPLLLALCVVARAAKPEVSEFFFPDPPQKARDIQMNGVPALRGKLLFYTPAKISIERADGVVIQVQPVELDESELVLFKGTAHATLAGAGKELNAIKSDLVALSEKVSDETVTDAVEKAKTQVMTIVREMVGRKEVQIQKLETENRLLRAELVKQGRRLESAENDPYGPLYRPATKPEGPREAPKAWREVAKFSGDGQQHTAPFEITSDQWRVRWSFRKSSDIAPLFAINARGRKEILLANTMTPGSETSYGSGKGRFSLDVTGLFAAWQIIVEELR